MENWIDILIFAVVIIANIIGGIIKLRQKRKAAEKTDMPSVEMQNDQSEDFDEEDMYFEEESVTQNTYSSQYAAQNDFAAPQVSYVQPEVVNTPAAEIEVQEANAQYTPQIQDIDDDAPMDYGEFIRKHGREAFILTEIILPANSRQRS